MEHDDGESDSDVEMINDILEPDDLFNDEALEGGDGGDDDDDDQNDGEKQQEKKEEVSKSKLVKQRRVQSQKNALISFSTLEGSNGLSALKNLFKNFKFKGSGHEEEDLVKIMGILQQWMCFKLSPRYDFESCMHHLEVLGKKKSVRTLMKKFRLGMNEWGESQPDTETPVQNNPENGENSDKNEFDLLLDEEMANIGTEDELSQHEEVQTQPNAQTEVEVTLTPDQLERIARNRKLAEERRLMKMKERHEGMEVDQLSEKMGDQEISLERINLDEKS